MARKKAGASSEKTVEETQENEKKNSLAARLSALDKFCAAATKNNLALAGRINVVPEIKERLTVKYIPTPSEDINRLVGGGIPRGKLTIISGAPDSGKSHLVLETIGKYLSNDEKAIAVWIESENSVDKQAAIDLHHVDPDRFYFIAQDNKNSAEGIGDLLTNLLSSDLRPDIIVINSLKMLTTKNETDRSLSKQSMAEQARFNSRLMNKLIPLLAEADCALVVVQPLSTSLAVMMGDPLILSGGLAIRYAASMIWELRKQSVLDADPIAKTDGMKIKMTCRKNHCLTDRYPYGSVIYYVEYGKGIEQILSMLKILVDEGVLVSRGAWIYLFDENGEKQPDWTWQSRAVFKQDMDEHPEKLEHLIGLLREKDAKMDLIEELTDEEIAEIEEEDRAEEEAINNFSEE